MRPSPRRSSVTSVTGADRSCAPGNSSTHVHHVRFILEGRWSPSNGSATNGALYFRGRDDVLLRLRGSGSTDAVMMTGRMIHADRAQSLKRTSATGMMSPFAPTPHGWRPPVDDDEDLPF